MDEAIKQYIEDDIQENAIIYASVFGINTAQVAAAVESFMEAARVISKHINETFENLRLLLNEYNLWIEKNTVVEKKKQVHKLNLARPIIKHQVLDRKPRQLIKRVII